MTDVTLAMAVGANASPGAPHGSKPVAPVPVPSGPRTAETAGPAVGAGGRSAVGPWPQPLPVGLCGQVLRYSEMVLSFGAGQRNCSYRVSLSTKRFSQAIEYLAIVVLELFGAKWLAPRSSRYALSSE